MEDRRFHEKGHSKKRPPLSPAAEADRSLGSAGLMGGLLSRLTGSNSGRLESSLSAPIESIANRRAASSFARWLPSGISAQHFGGEGEFRERVKATDTKVADSAGRANMVKPLTGTAPCGKIIGSHEKAGRNEFRPAGWIRVTAPGSGFQSLMSIAAYSPSFRR